MPTLDGGTPTGLPEAPSDLTVIETIILLAQQQLQDMTGQTWGPDILIPYINLAVNEIITLKPDAYPVTKVIALVAGATQTLDDTAIELLDIVCNMGTNGATPGRAITSLDRQSVDFLFPDWQTATVGSVVLFYMKDDRNPKYFYTFPPMAAASPMPQIKLIQSEIPADISAVDDDFPLDASYIPATVDYIIFRALAEPTTIAGAMEKAKIYMNKFYQNIGIKQAVEKTIEKKEAGTGNVSNSQ
jgi:hypothetical protein